MKVTCMFWSQKHLTLPGNNIQNVLTNIKIIYIYIYIYKTHPREWRDNYAQTKLLWWMIKQKWKIPGGWKINMSSELKQRKEPNRMESVANTAAIWKGCSSQGCLRCVGQNQGRHGARVAWVQEAGSDIQFQNLHVMEKARGGLKVISLSSIHIDSQGDFILLILVALWKKVLFLQTELSYSIVYFLTKQKYAFFLLLLSKQS